MRTFPIEVKPWSHQSAREQKSKIKAQIAGYSKERNLQIPYCPNGELCLRIIFVSPFGGHLKDCDNLAKGLLDSLTGYLYKDDKQVTHLDVLRVTAAGTEGYVLVSVAKTDVNEHEDVVVKDKHAKILWMDTGSLESAG